MYFILYRKKTDSWITVEIPDNVIIDDINSEESCVVAYLKEKYADFEIYSIIL